MRGKDLLLALSIIGIWPRYIEPFWLREKKLSVPLQGLKAPLRIAHLTDLHFQRETRDRFLEKLLQKTEAAKPDLIVITGDFLCRSRLEEAPRLLHFLQGLFAPLGVFAVLGNHDFAHYVTKHPSGLCDLDENETGLVKKCLAKLFSKGGKTHYAPRVQQVAMHEGLLAVLKEAGVRVLENESAALLWHGGVVTVTGLGELFLQRANPERAFATAMGASIVLMHNPDLFHALQDFPGDLHLAGHSHGGQINLPWLRHKMVPLDNPRYRAGLFCHKEKTLIVSRGLGGHEPSRLFCRPELLLIDCQPA